MPTPAEQLAEFTSAAQNAAAVELQNAQEPAIMTAEEFFKHLEDEETQGAQDAQPAEPEAVQPQSGAVTAPSGNVDPALLELQRGQVAVSERLAQLLERQAASAPEEPADDGLPEFKIDVQDLTPEELESYQASKPFVDKVAGRAVASALTRFQQEVVAPIHKQARELQAQMAQMQSASAQQANTSADMQLRTLTSGKVGNYAEFIASPTWQGYLDKEVPGGEGITYRTIATQHASRGDLSALANMMIAANTSVQAPQKRVTPGNSVAGVPVHRGGQPKALPYSGFRRATEMRAQGKLADADFARISAEYQAASMQGRVDYDR